MSLAARITLVVVIILAAAGVVAGLTVHAAVRRALEAKLQSLLAARIVWLETALDVDLEDGELALDDRREPPEAAGSWQVATSGGMILWTSPGPAQQANVAARTSTLVFGKSTWPALRDHEIVSEKDEDRRDAAWGDVPQVVRDAVQNAVPGFVPTDVSRGKRVGPPFEFYKIDGLAGGREYWLDVLPDGFLHDVTEKGIIEYEFTKGRRRLTLVLTAYTSRAGMNLELNRIVRSMWMAGPVALLIAGALLALLIHWQLRPLARMAEQAGRIGPQNVSARIGPVGTVRECLKLRDSINAMLARLAQGMAQERRFSAVAAHELRSPLAQLRTTIEVALRRERSVGEYQSALQETLADVERLQALMERLLELTRLGDSAALKGHPVSLSAIAKKAARDHDAVELALDGTAEEFLVAGDEQLLNRAIGNVLENAARYAPQAPPAIRVEQDNGQVRLVIADRGPGVPEAEREGIFEPLTRLDPARSIASSSSGFGLGLSVARSAVRAFGGDLVCRARADGQSGAEFVFSFRTASVEAP